MLGLLGWSLLRALVSGDPYAKELELRRIADKYRPG